MYMYMYLHIDKLLKDTRAVVAEQEQHLAIPKSISNLCFARHSKQKKKKYEFHFIRNVDNIPGTDD